MSQSIAEQLGRMRSKLDIAECLAKKGHKERLGIIICEFEKLAKQVNECSAELQTYRSFYGRINWKEQP